MREEEKWGTWPFALRGRKGEKVNLVKKRKCAQVSLHACGSNQEKSDLENCKRLGCGTNDGVRDGMAINSFWVPEPWCNTISIIQ